MTSSPRVKTRSGYLPSLDGWRALAILGVMITHDMPWTLGRYSTARYKGFGGVGVQLFFAISGLLITTRILEEEKLRGHFDLRGFYIRRLFRIQPAAYAYLAVIGLLMLLGILHQPWIYWWGAVGFFENFLFKGISHIPESFFVGHFWSLAVEEHFYILLSLFLFFVHKRRVVWLAAATFVLFAINHYAQIHGLYDGMATGRRTYWQLQNLTLPATMAVALQFGPVREFVRKWLHPWTAALYTIALVVLHRWMYSRHHADAFTLFGFASEAGFVATYCFAVWVLSTMTHGESFATRVLEIRWLRWIGRISYSLYLWHVLFFFQAEPATGVTNPVLVALSGRVVKFVAALAVAVASYYLLEKPCMRLGHRLAPPSTPGRPELADVTPSTATHAAIAAN
jgi:peptidoglycan/LPS O-acetylase OafA/YrhL